MERPGRPDLDRLLRPRSVAVIGASQNQAQPGSRVVQALGRNPAIAVYAVNPRHREVLGVRCFPAVSDLPVVPDLVVVAVPADHVVDLVDGAAEAGAGDFVVLSSAFAEASGPGAALQDRLAALAARRGLRVLGPNTVGYANFLDGVYCSFNAAVVEGELRPGGVAVVTQSGAMAGVTYALAVQRRFGLSHLLSTGNEAVLDVSAIGDHLLRDSRVQAVAMFVEAIRDGEAFKAFAQSCQAAGRPLVLLRAGFSSGGRAAVQSHTGALAGSREVTAAVCRRFGVIQVDTPEELVLVCENLGSSKPLRGRRLGVLSGSGGMAAVLADQAERAGVELPQPARATRERLAVLLPAYAYIGNPTDLTPAPFYERGVLNRCIAALGADPGLDGVLVYLQAGGSWAEPAASEIAGGAVAMDRYCGVIWLASPEASRTALAAAGVAAFDAVAVTMTALGKVGRWHAALAAGAMGGLPAIDRSRWIALRTALERHAGTEVNEFEGKSLLARAGLPGIAEQHLVSSVDDLPHRLPGLDSPAAVKLIARGLGHKTAAGAVLLAVKPAGLERACRTLFALGERLGTTVAGVLIERMAKPGVEVLVGTKWDAEFGPVVVVGSGGVNAEVYGDVALAPAPLNEQEVRDLLGCTRVAELLRPGGGRPGADVDALCQLIQRVSELAVGAGDVLRELDLNPVIVHAEGLSIVDCLMVLGEPVPSRPG